MNLCYNTPATSQPSWLQHGRDFQEKERRKNTETLAVPSSFYTKATKKPRSCTFRGKLFSPHICAFTLTDL